MAVKRWNGTAWEVYAGADLAPVKVTDGRVGKTTFIGATSPTGQVDGDIWIDQDTTTNAVVPTALLAKGDIFVATASGAYTRLAAGNNGESLFADFTTSTGLRWQPSYTGGKNAIINGGMDIWQRGTSKLDGANNYHTADRWQLSSAPAITFSRQTTGDTTNLPFIQYCMRLQRTPGSTNTNNANISQSLESVNSIPFAGKTITLSFYARKGANYSAINSDITVALNTGTGTDQNVYTQGYTGSVAAINQSAVLTTTWQRFAYTVTLATNTNEIGLIFIGTQSGTAGANDWYEITGVQLEVGSTATSFSRAGGDIQGELAKCQRYFQKIGTDGNAYQLFTVCTAESSTTAWGPVYLPVKMRVTPSGSFSSTQPWNLQGQNISNANMYFDPNQTGPNIVTIGTLSATGMTAFQSRYLRSNNDTTTCLNLSAEL